MTEEKIKTVVLTPRERKLISLEVRLAVKEELCEFYKAMAELLTKFAKVDERDNSSQKDV